MTFKLCSGETGNLVNIAKCGSGEVFQYFDSQTFSFGPEA